MAAVCGPSSCPAKGCDPLLQPLAAYPGQGLPVLARPPHAGEGLGNSAAAVYPLGRCLQQVTFHFFSFPTAEQISAYWTSQQSLL